MKTLLILAISAVLVAGCASQTPSPVVEAPRLPETVILPEQIDIQCSDMAKVARTFALIRDAGISPFDATMMIGTLPEYPVGPIVREVYDRADVNPLIGAAGLYQVCKSRTYEGMMQVLHTAEAKFVEAEQTRLRAEQTRLQAERVKKKRSALPPKSSKKKP